MTRGARSETLSVKAVLQLQEQNTLADFEAAVRERLPDMPGRTRRGARQVLAACALVATIAGFGFDGAAAIGDTLRAPTTQEQMIEQTVHKAYGTTDTVRCLSDAALYRRGFWGSAVGKTWIPGYPLVWIDQQACDALTAFKRQPLGYNPDATIDDVGQTQLSDAADAAGLLAHELGHANKAIVNEGDANCFAAQESYRILVALGAGTATLELRQYTAAAVEQNARDVVGGPDRPGGHPEYALPSDCILP
jgi:hypothetical protein